MVCSVSMYPSVKTALSQNASLEKLVNDEYSGNARFFQYLEDLIRELLDGNGTGIPEKMKDVGSLDKMESCFAELYIGRIFLRKGFSVAFLPDNYSSKQSPDLAIEKNGVRMLIEVMRIGDGPILDILLKELTSFLKGKSFRVNINLDEHFSLPPVGYDEVKRVGVEVQESLTELKSYFPTQPGEYAIKTKHITYQIQSISKPDGYVGIIRGTPTGVPVEKIIDYIGYWMNKKANKRDDFDDSDKACPYIIAFASQIIYLDGALFQEELYGKVMGYPEHDIREREQIVKKDYEEQVKLFKSTPEWKIIEDAESHGWGELLESVHLIPGNCLYVYEHGRYLTEKPLVNVAGILYMTTPENCTLFPNPFSDPAMGPLDATMLIKGLWLRPF